LIFFSGATRAESFFASFQDNAFATKFTPGKMFDANTGKRVYEISDNIQIFLIVRSSISGWWPGYDNSNHAGVDHS